MELLLVFSLALTLFSVDASLPYSLPERYEDIFVPRDLPSTVEPSLVTGIASSGMPTTAPVLVTLITSSSSTYESLSGAPFHTASWNSSSIATSVGKSSFVSQLSSPENIISATSAFNHNSTVGNRPSYIPTTSDSTSASSSTPQASSPSIPASSENSQAPNSLAIPNSSLLSASFSPIANETALPSVSSVHESDLRTNSPVTVTATLSAPNGVPSTVTIVTTTQAEEHDTMSSPQSSQTPVASAAIPAGSGVEVMLSNVAYQLPSSSERPMEIMLTNGSVAQLFASRIILEGKTITVPSDINSATELPGGITAKPAEASIPHSSDDDNDNDGHHGGGGLFGALGSIASGAKSALGGAINDVGTVSTTAMAFAGGAAGATTGFAGSLTGAIGGTSSLVASFNGIQKSFSGSQLSKSALDTLTGAHSLGRQALNWMKSTENLVQDFPNLPADVQSKLRERVGDFAKKGGQLDQYKQALETFQKFPWEEAKLPNPSPTLTPSGTTRPTNTDSVTISQSSSVSQSKTSLKSSTKPQSTTQSESTMTSSQTSSSSSGTPTPTAETMHEYFISSKEGTDWPNFENLIKNIDVVPKSVIRWDNIGAYMCLAMMNSTQAEEMKQSHDFVETVFLNEADPELGDLDDLDGIVEHFRAVGTQRQHETDLQKAVSSLSSDHSFTKDANSGTSLVSRTMGSPDSSAPWWKKMLSAPPPKSNEAPIAPSLYPGYQADDTGGSGTTIYILDDGFDISLPQDFLTNGRTISTHIVPNEYTLLREVRNRGVPEDIRGRNNPDHGTIMASLAGGAITGVAPRADLHLVKVKGEYYHNSGGGKSTSFHTVQSIQYFTEHIKSHIFQRKRARRNGDPELRSVINMSSGVRVTTYPSKEKMEEFKKAFQKLIDFCQEEQIPYVVAAGNVPDVEDVNQNIPHILSRPQDSMIVVGGVNEEGRRFSLMPTDSDGLVHIWSPAENIQHPKSATEVETKSGTSQAAAIVSGLIAYYYGLSSMNHDHVDVNGGFEGAKGLVKSHAWSRSPADPLIKVVYNLARGDLVHDTFPCVRRRDILGNPQSSGFCSVSSVSASSASSSASATSFSTAISSSSMLSKASSATSNLPTSLPSRSFSFLSTKTRGPKPTSSPRPSTPSNKPSEPTSKQEKPKTSTRTSEAPTKPTKSQRPQEPQRTGGYLSPPAPTPTERKHSCLNMIGLNSVYCNGPPAEVAA
ncbi:subtilisin-like protein [Curvularia clavata]|uniref:Subtilisin-like protein n=1 Tax=Curvularia clavata TaxID=95742 RepID=A0A9Q8ZGJ0_CURCL|nr:subtilisin-like protein [Curvularia clavata]